MVLEPVRCPVCHGIHVNKYGKTEDGKQRYICRNRTCSGKTFIREYSELGRLPEVKEQIIWLWYAIDHKTGKLLSYVLGDRKDTAFLKL